MESKSCDFTIKTVLSSKNDICIEFARHIVCIDTLFKTGKISSFYD